MVKSIMLNGHKHNLHFRFKNGKAENVHFGAGDAELLHDLVVEFGPTAKLHDVIEQLTTKLNDKLKLYHVVINEVRCYDYTYEVWAFDEDDAKEMAMTGEGDPVSEHEISTDFHVEECNLFEGDDDGVDE
jgi:hypothetical protein